MKIALAPLAALTLGVFATLHAADSSQPFLAKPEAPEVSFKILRNWTFGKSRPGATIHNKTELDQEFYYRYIYDSGRLDKLKTYWSQHRDYPEGDPKSVHVFDADTLTLKGRVLPNGGLKDRGIDSGMLRGKYPIQAGMYVEMRAKVTTGIGAWPSFWLNPGVQFPDGKFGPLGWPPEIDIFEFFNWKGRPTSRIFESNIQTNGKPEKFGNPKSLFKSEKWAENYPNKGFDTGVDCSKDFHVWGLDWRKDEPIWLFDGVPIKQAHYVWAGPPAHVLVTNQIGIVLPSTSIEGMTADEKNWDFVIDYIRVWERKAPGSPPIPPVATPAPATPKPAPPVHAAKPAVPAVLPKPAVPAVTPKPAVLPATPKQAGSPSI